MRIVLSSSQTVWWIRGAEFAGNTRQQHNKRSSMSGQQPPGFQPQQQFNPYGQQPGVTGEQRQACWISSAAAHVRWLPGTDGCGFDVLYLQGQGRWRAPGASSRSSQASGQQASLRASLAPQGRLVSLSRLWELDWAPGSSGDAARVGPKRWVLPALLPLLTPLVLPRRVWAAQRC